MKIIQIMDSLNEAGGVNSFVFDLCIAMHESGQDITLIGILSDKERFKSQALTVKNAGVPVYSLYMSSKKGALLHGIPGLKKMVIDLSNGQPTICNLHLKLSVLMGCLATKGMKNVKCVETYHSRYSHYELEYKMMSRFISHYIPCSQSAGEEMVQRLHVPENKLTVIPNGVDCEGIRKLAGSAVPHGGVEILSVGRFTNQKNFETSIKAFKPLCKNDVYYRIIGDGEQAELLRDEIGSNSNIQLLGLRTRNQVFQRINNADLVVMPSRWEGLSIFLMEAMALRKPLMLSDIPSFTDTMGEKPLQDGETWRRCSWGYLVKTEDSIGYQEALNDFIGHKEMWASLEECVITLSTRYDIRNSAKRYLELYGKVV